MEPREKPRNTPERHLQAFLGIFCRACIHQRNSVPTDLNRDIGAIGAGSGNHEDFAVPNPPERQWWRGHRIVIGIAGRHHALKLSVNAGRPGKANHQYDDCQQHRCP